MSKNLALLALLTSLSLAAPIVESVERRNPLGLGLNLGANIGTGSTSISADLSSEIDITSLPSNPTSGVVPSNPLSITAGFTLDVAIALEASIAGVVAVSVDINARIALAQYLQGAGAQRFDPQVCKAIIKWCHSTDTYVVPVEVRNIFINIHVESILDPSVSSAGGYIQYLNQYIEQGHQQNCACSTLDQHSRQTLLVWLQSSAAINLDVSIMTSLQLAVTGGVAASLEVSAHASLIAWLSAPHCPLDPSIVVIIKAWLQISTGVTTAPPPPSYPVTTPTVPTVPSVPAISVDTHIIVDIQTQTTLIAWISAQVDLDISVRAALQTCAYGGPSIAIDAQLRAALTAYLSSSYCTLPSDLIVIIQLWLSAQTGPSVITAPKPTLPYTNTAVSVYSNVDPSGSLSIEYQTQLGNWCSANSYSVSTTVITALKSCAHGGLATDLDASIAIALQAFLSSPACPIEPTLRASIIVWLSAAVTVSSSHSSGVGAGVVVSDTTSISALLTADIALSATVRAALGVVVAGDVAGVLDLSVRAELTAFLVGPAAVSVDATVVTTLLGWVSGVTM
ncbi:hypothetical protein BGZ60DRAFT_416612 [Tricladium varicosporioides]|nr:hypothetical protein BGZ60DRAFT_416612 [Hymenoscyphus varicosporioides]